MEYDELLFSLGTFLLNWSLLVLDHSWVGVGQINLKYSTNGHLGDGSIFLSPKGATGHHIILTFRKDIYHHLLAPLKESEFRWALIIYFTNHFILHFLEDRSTHPSLEGVYAPERGAGQLTFHYTNDTFQDRSTYRSTLSLVGSDK